MLRTTLLLVAAVLFQQAPSRDAACAVSAATATISGTVVDAASKLPMPRVRVSIGSDYRVTYTDTAGRFAFPKLPPGTLKLSAQYSGYLTASVGAKKPGRSVWHW